MNSQKNRNQLVPSYYELRKQLKSAETTCSQQALEITKLEIKLVVMERKLKSVRHELWLALATVILITIVATSGVLA